MLNLEQYLKDLEEIVNIDSGTYDFNGVNKVQDWFIERFKTFGYNAKIFETTNNLGKSVLYTSNANDNYDLLILCHADTVFPEGEVQKRPFTINREKNEIYGPGTADMKGGCLFTLYALKELIDNKTKCGNIAVFFNGEHEIGCPNTRKIMEDLIIKSRIVIAAECTRGNGAYVKRRKGILRYTFSFEGVAAHSGNNPEDGECAILEMAQWITALKGMQDFQRGITINTGMVKGGVSVNSIPDSAELRIDIRVNELDDAYFIEKKVKSMKPFNNKVKVSISGGITRPPMVPNNQTEILCGIMEKIGKEYGINVTWAFAGGGSDGSFASALNKPVLCGLTPVGKGAHTKEEIVFLSDINERYCIFRDTVSAFSLLSDEDLSQL